MTTGSIMRPLYRSGIFTLGLGRALRGISNRVPGLLHILSTSK
jgi:hypothetical protein